MTPDARTPLNPHLTAAELANLSLRRDAQVRAPVAAHPNSTPYDLGTLAAESPVQELSNPALPLLRQPPVPAWLFQQLQQHHSVEVQMALARHPQLPGDMVRAFAAHPARLVRARIAAHPDLPCALFKDLLHDPDDSVRLAVASRGDLGAGERAALGRDPSRFVRQAHTESSGHLSRECLYLECCPPEGGLLPANTPHRETRESGRWEQPD